MASEALNKFVKLLIRSLQMNILRYFCSFVMNKKYWFYSFVPEEFISLYFSTNIIRHERTIETYHI